MKFLVFPTVLLLLACSAPQIRSNNSKALEFDNILQFYKNADYKKTLEQINIYLELNPQTSRLVEALYLKGKTHRFLNQYPECIETFQNVVELTKLQKSSYFNYSLYETGICLEMISETQKAIAVYQDALRSKENLPSQLRDLEIPSRLALAYAKIGEKKSADLYSQQLQKSLKSYLSKAQLNESEKAFYAEMLFGMSVLEIQVQDQMDFNTTLDILNRNRETLVYLLKFDVKAYSQKALDLYFSNYSKILNYIKTIKVHTQLDPVLAQRTKEEFQSKMSLQVLENIETLETVVLPESLDENYKVSFETLSKLKKEFEVLSQTQIGSSSLTPEALQQQTVKKKGIVIDEPSLPQEVEAFKKSNTPNPSTNTIETDVKIKEVNPSQTKSSDSNLNSNSAEEKK